jgi:hypothetical protein
MSMMIESIIRRRAAYSTILLSDTLKKFISPSFAVILLRVIMLFLKGLCTPLLLSAADGIEYPVGKQRPTEDSLSSVFKCVSTHTGSPTASYNEIDINNAVCWAEALLDSHFSSLAFRASFHASTRQALSCVMRTGKHHMSLSAWDGPISYPPPQISSALTGLKKISPMDLVYSSFRNTHFL